MSTSREDSWLLTGSWNETTTVENTNITHTRGSMLSHPLYQATVMIYTVCPPILIVLGTFGHAMTLVIMRRMKSSESTVNIYFTAIAVADLITIYTVILYGFLLFGFKITMDNLHSVGCKLFIWVYTASGTLSAWYLVCMTVHRAMSVVWPHRVNLLCTRRTVLLLLTGITVFMAILYSHYLVGFDLIVSNGSFICTMASKDYIEFAEKIFTYIELTVYSVLPFTFLVIANGILIWKLTVSVKEARQNLSQGASEQVAAREKAATSVTLTVIIVSLTFIFLTLPEAINYMMTYFVVPEVQISVSERAHAYFYGTILNTMGNCNSAVNFYLYCLTGRRFREEFIKVMCCGRIRRPNQ